MEKRGCGYIIHHFSVLDAHCVRFNPVLQRDPPTGPVRGQAPGAPLPPPPPPLHRSHVRPQT